MAEYLEIHGRVQLLNDRFSVMQELLDILRSHAQASGGWHCLWGTQTACL